MSQRGGTSCLFLRDVMFWREGNITTQNQRCTQGIPPRKNPIKIIIVKGPGSLNGEEVYDVVGVKWLGFTPKGQSSWRVAAQTAQGAALIRR